MARLLPLFGREDEAPPPQPLLDQFGVVAGVLGDVGRADGDRARSAGVGELDLEDGPHQPGCYSLSADERTPFLLISGEAVA